jgi:hypothetical protein
MTYKIASSGESRPLGKVEIDCRKAAPKEERVGRSCESTDKDRLPQGSPKGAASGTMQVNLQNRDLWERSR